MKTHKYFELLKEHDLIHIYSNEQYFGKFEIFYNLNENELSVNVNLLKMSIEKLSLDLNELKSAKENSRMKFFDIREKNKS
jgi:hypothetical protein